MKVRFQDLFMFKSYQNLKMFLFLIPAGMLGRALIILVIQKINIIIFKFMEVLLQSGINIGLLKCYNSIYFRFKHEKMVKTFKFLHVKN